MKLKIINKGIDCIQGTIDNDELFMADIAQSTITHLWITADEKWLEVPLNSVMWKPLIGFINRSLNNERFRDKHHRNWVSDISGNIVVDNSEEWS